MSSSFDPPVLESTTVDRLTCSGFKCQLEPVRGCLTFFIEMYPGLGKDTAQDEGGIPAGDRAG